LAKFVYEEMREEGVLMGFGLGKYGKKKTLRIMPPLCLDFKDIDEIFMKLEIVFNKKRSVDFGWIKI